MRDRRFIAFAASLFVAVSVVGVWAVDRTSRPLTGSAGAFSPLPVTNWRVAFNSATADGTSVASPFAASDWNTSGYEVGTAGGRICLNRDGAERFEVLCLFTTAGASADVQVYGFDYVLTGDCSTSSTQSLRAPGPADVNLGVPYPLAADDGATTFSVSATTLTWKASISSTDFIHPDETGGTTYYVGPRQIFDIAGLFAFWTRVESISAGTLVVLVRVV